MNRPSSRHKTLILIFVALLQMLPAHAQSLPPRPTGSAIDAGNPLFANLTGLFIMNEGTGTIDKNVVDGQNGTFSGTSLPTWNATDPSIVFNGGASMNSYLDAGNGANKSFDYLAFGKMTIVAKIYVTSRVQTGIVEK